MTSSLQPKTEYSMKLENLSGGLNLAKAEYQLDADESPDMKNLLWRNGRLASRRGMKYLNSDASHGQTWGMYDSLWHGFLFAHIGSKIWACDAADGTLTEVCSGVPASFGTFFLYDGELFYKCPGAYKRITAAQSGGVWSFTGSNVTGYVPVIVINASPADGSGDLYQPENRYSAHKTVWYNAVQGETHYYLPVPADVVIRVEVDGTVLTSGWSYSPGLGCVVFDDPPPVTTPPTNNTVRITYSKTNTAAYASINTCKYAAVYGGTGELCVVLAGCVGNPNAYFWSGNSNIAMDPGYFPMEQYQIAGEKENPITGFGKQQSALIVFSEHSVGKTVLGVTETGTGGNGAGNGGTQRLSIDMPYTPINAKIGCLYPRSIQLVENNLVWAGSQGIYVLLDTTDANENSIRCISGKINGTPPGASSSMRIKGLLYNLEQETSRETVCSADDEHRYCITCNGVSYCWDYEISGSKDPSWFLLTNTRFVRMAYFENELYFTNSAGQFLRLQKEFNDFGSAIERYYRIGSQNFGSDDCLKNVNSVIVELGAETETDTTVTYITDYGEYNDPTNLQVVPANDYETDRIPGTRPENSNRPAVFRRRPMCRRIIHFSMKLRNANINEDLAIVSAEIYFQKMGRLR